MVHNFERHQKFYKPETKVPSKTIIYNTLSERDVSTYIKNNHKQNLCKSENKDDLKVIESELLPSRDLKEKKPRLKNQQQP